MKVSQELCAKAQDHKSAIKTHITQINEEIQSLMNISILEPEERQKLFDSLKNIASAESKFKKVVNNYLGY